MMWKWIGSMKQSRKQATKTYVVNKDDCHCENNFYESDTTESGSVLSFYDITKASGDDTTDSENEPIRNVNESGNGKVVKQKSFSLNDFISKRMSKTKYSLSNSEKHVEDFPKDKGYLKRNSHKSYLEGFDNITKDFDRKLQCRGTKSVFRLEKKRSNGKEKYLIKRNSISPNDKVAPKDNLQKNKSFLAPQDNPQKNKSFLYDTQKFSVPSNVDVSLERERISSMCEKKKIDVTESLYPEMDYQTQCMFEQPASSFDYCYKIARSYNFPNVRRSSSDFCTKKKDISNIEDNHSTNVSNDYQPFVRKNSSLLPQIRINAPSPMPAISEKSKTPHTLLTSRSLALPSYTLSASGSESPMSDDSGLGKLSLPSIKSISPRYSRYYSDFSESSSVTSMSPVDFLSYNSSAKDASHMDTLVGHREVRCQDDVKETSKSVVKDISSRRHFKRKKSKSNMYFALPTKVENTKYTEKRCEDRKLKLAETKRFESLNTGSIFSDVGQINNFKCVNVRKKYQQGKKRVTGKTALSKNINVDRRRTSESGHLKTTKTNSLPKDFRE